MIRQVAALAGLVAVAAVLWLSSLGVQSLTAPAPPPVVITRTLVVAAPTPTPTFPVPPLPAVAEAEPTPTPAAAASSMAQVQEPRRYYDAESLIPLLQRTFWPREMWSNVIRVVMCESGGDRLAVGDLDLLPFDGPSKGLGQVNVLAHAVYASMYDLFDAWQNLIVLHLIWRDADGSFTPWKKCSAALGLS